MKLNDLMDFGHVVHSDGNGYVTDDSDVVTSEIKLHAPESVYLDLDADGQSYDDDYHGMSSEWTPLQGFTGQYGYSGPTMHPSEFIGGYMEDHIRETAGFYVAVAVDGYGPEETEDEPESIGWAVLYRD